MGTYSLNLQDPVLIVPKDTSLVAAIEATSRAVELLAQGQGSLTFAQTVN